MRQEGKGRAKEGIASRIRANSLTLDVLYPEVSNLRKLLLRNYNICCLSP